MKKKKPTSSVGVQINRLPEKGTPVYEAIKAAIVSSGMGDEIHRQANEILEFVQRRPNLFPPLGAAHVWREKVRAKLWSAVYAKSVGDPKRAADEAVALFDQRFPRNLP